MSTGIYLQDPHLMQCANGWCLVHERGLNYEKSCFLPVFSKLLEKTEHVAFILL